MSINIILCSWQLEKFYFSQLLVIYVMHFKFQHPSWVNVPIQYRLFCDQIKVCYVFLFNGCFDCLITFGSFGFAWKRNVCASISISFVYFNISLVELYDGKVCRLWLVPIPFLKMWLLTMNMCITEWHVYMCSIPCLQNYCIFWVFVLLHLMVKVYVNGYDHSRIYIF